MIFSSGEREGEGGELFSMVSSIPGHRNNLRAGHTEVTNLAGGVLLMEPVLVHSAYGDRGQTGQIQAEHEIQQQGLCQKYPILPARMLSAELRSFIKSNCCSLSISGLWNTSEPNSSPVTTGNTGNGSVNINLVSITRCSAGTKPPMRHISYGCSFLL